MKQKKRIKQLYLLLVLSTLPLLSWGKTEGLQQQMQEVIGCLVDSRLVEADSLASLINDHDILQLDSLQKNCFYIKGLAKYGVADDVSAIYYFEKARELYMNEGLYDNNFLNMTLFLCDSYVNKGDYNTPASYLRKAIIRYVDQFEANPSYAVKLYSQLADVYFANGDTLWSDRVHVEKIEYYVIKDYMKMHPNDTLGDQILNSYNSYRTMVDQYSNLHNIHDEVFIGSAELEAENLAKINANKEAEWYYLYCIRLSSKYIEGFSDFTMFAYMNILRLYANQNIEDFNALFPKAIEYAERDPSKYYNEFYFSQIFGNIFSEQGDKQQAYILYKRCVSYLDSGNHVEDEIKHKTSIYMSLMAICDDLGYYQEALSYHPFLESQLKNEDGERYYNYKSNLFIALMGIEDYEKSLLVIEELEQLKLSTNDTLSQQYIELLLIKGQNLFFLNKETDAKTTFNSVYSLLQNHSNDITNIQGYIYSSLASGLMVFGEYDKALTMLEKSAEIELKDFGQISETTIDDINECKKHL